STGGVAADLRRCLQELRHLGRITVFAPGENDASDRFQLPQRLYGRQRETEIILNAFERASAAEKRVVLVSGPSGIGKSALVQEVQKPIAATRGYFVAGKCEALNRNIPYAAFTQAFRDLVRQLETESPESVARWRQSILEAVGTSGRVIMDIVPELESIIGAQPSVPVLDPEESQIRFNATFRRFVRVFCRFGQPFVLFFDDVQWIDAAGLRLLRAILLDSQISNLMLVWSFRDDEAGGTAPITRLVDEATQMGLGIDQIKVSPLGKTDVHQLISDGLRGRHQDLAALASVVCERCDGNPLFVSQYLDHLHREGVIQFVHGLGSWTWDPAGLGEGQVTDGIADLMRAKILKAPAAARQTLQIAACIGSSFDLRMLSIVSEKPRHVLAAELQAALAEGFVTLVGASYRLFESSLPDAHVAFRFVHDRVQQSVHDMLEDDARKRVHLRIARLLIARSREADGGDHLFEIVDHLNQAWDLLSDPTERSEAVALNLRAGIRAKANVAYDVAARSLRHAMANLPPRAWTEHYEQTSQLFLECADCEYLCGNFDVAEQLLDEASIHLRSNVERALVYDIKIPMRTNRGRPADAIRLGIEALALFDIELVAKPSPALVTEAIVTTRRRLSGLSVEELLHLPEMVDREKLAIMRIFNRLGPPAYFTDQGLYSLMHCLVIELTLEYGHASESVRGYSVYGMILGWHFGSYEEGARYGELGIQLSDKLANVQMKGVSRALYGCFICHWTHAIDESLIHLREGHQLLREAGNVVLGSFALCIHTVTMWIKGEPLDRVRADAAKSLAYLRQAKYREMIDFMSCVDRAAMSLAGQTQSPTSLDGDGAGDDFDENTTVFSMRGVGIKTPLHWYCLSKAQLFYLFDRLDDAAEMAERSAEMLPHSQGSLLNAEHHLLSALIALGRGERPDASAGADADTDADGARGLGQSRRLLAQWAVHCPENFAAKHLLVEAECARVTEEHESAVDLYERAVTAARAEKNLFIEALANERGGRYHLGRKRTFIASSYLKQARYVYSRWGASAKVNQLDQEFGALLGPATLRSTSDARKFEALRLPGESSEGLDVSAIMKSARAIGEVIVLDRLIKKVTRTLVESAGAQIGVIVFAGSDGLRVVARRHIDDPEDAVSIDMPLDAYSDIAASVVKKAAADQAIVLYEDAAKSAELKGDPYVQQTQPRSVLCFPAMHQGRVSCIVYLENNLAPGMFTRERVEVLRILSSQVAISLENARLYSGLEEKIRLLEEAQEGLKEKERLMREMEIARRIQTSILPGALEVPGLDIAATMLPATEVGGDYYDVVPVEGGCWLGIGDVAGHGLGSGLVMLMIQSGLAVLTREAPDASPRELLRVLNQMLYDNVRKRLGQQEHATLSLLRYRTDGQFTYAGAHEEFIVWRAQEQRCELIATRGIWMAAIPNIPRSMVDQRFRLLPDDVLVLYTDGVIEATNQHRRQLGVERICDALAQVHSQPVEAIRDHLMTVVKNWMSRQDDDITFLIARYRGSE
ncbi:MAG: hypothetical protein QOI66_3895, partial [Myxococcales bacterium]|nr:hypothetical protein [Myxococcales bacterium]